FFDNESPAFSLEISLIKRFGRRDLQTGSLCNMTSGGEGVSQPNEELREKRSEARLGKPFDSVNDRYITADGKTLKLNDWARDLGCHPAALIQRVIKQGMTWEEAVTTP